MIIKIQKDLVPGIRIEASRSEHENCNEINSSETQEKLTRLINKTIKAAQINKPSFFLRMTSQDRTSEMNGISE